MSHDFLRTVSPPVGLISITQFLAWAAKVDWLGWAGVLTSIAWLIFGIAKWRAERREKAKKT